jgi:DNA-binding transcriptional LysR family regulator
MYLQLTELAAFRAAASSLSFSRAAEELDRAQSSISAQIANLERAMHVRLFDRVGRGVVLTEAGRRLLPYAERMLDLEVAARAALDRSGEPAGEVIFSAPESICAYRLPPLLRAIHDDAPSIQLTFRPLPSAELEARVRDGSIDVAFALDYPLALDGLGVEPLRPEPIVLLTAAGDTLLDASTVRPSEIASRPLLLTEPGCTYRSAFLHALAESGVRARSILDVASIDAIKRCVMEGLGVTILPACVATDEIRDGRLAKLTMSGWALEMQLQMLWNPARWSSPALGAFLDTARRVLRE